REQVAVAQQGARLRRRVQRQRDPPGRRQRLRALDRLAQQGAQLQRRAVGLLLQVLQAREGEQVGDQALQGIRLRGTLVDVLPHLLGRRGDPFLQPSQVRAQGEERRAQVVRDGADEQPALLLERGL